MPFDTFGYRRESWTVQASALHAPLLGELRRYVGANGLTFDDATPCLETRSERRPGLMDRLLGRDTTSRSALTIAPGFVVWVVLGERAADAVAASIPLAAVGVTRGLGGMGAAFAGASEVRGVTFLGTMLGAAKATTTFVGFGREVDTDHFVDRLREALREAGNVRPI